MASDRNPVSDGQSPEVRAFLLEIAAVCRKHGLSLSHEDDHGAFEVERYSEYLTGWLLDARDRTATRDL